MSAGSKPSGSKLVLGMVALALVLGLGSWWYRYEAAHRATQFWGTRAAGAIARPDQVIGMELADPLPPGGEISPEKASTIMRIGSEVYPVASKKDLVSARGIKHMDSLLLADHNFRWDRPVVNQRWKWAMLFVNNAGTARVLFSDDLQSVGMLDLEGLQVKAVDCTPLKSALEEYLARADVFGASKPEE